MQENTLSIFNQKELSSMMKVEGYSIKDLEVLSGIKMHTIRIWEQRYSLLNPIRTATNIRSYSDDDLKKLLNISFLTRNGYKISKIAALNNDEIRDIVINISDSQTSGPEYINKLLLQMVNLDIAGFEKLVNEILERYSFEEACFSIFFKLFEKVGTYWQAGSIFPAQEHYITHLFRQKLIAAIDQLEPQYNQPVFLFYLPENELHELGLLFYSYLARKLNYNVFYLGQSVPIEDLQKLQSKLDVQYVFTSFVNSITKNDLEEYLLKLKIIFEKQRVFISGYQVQQHMPQLPRKFKILKDHKEFKKWLSR